MQSIATRGEYIPVDSTADPFPTTVALLYMQQVSIAFVLVDQTGTLLIEKRQSHPLVNRLERLIIQIFQEGSNTGSNRLIIFNGEYFCRRFRFGSRCLLIGIGAGAIDLTGCWGKRLKHPRIPVHYARTGSAKIPRRQHRTRPPPDPGQPFFHPGPAT